MRARDVRSVWAAAFPCVMSDKLIRAHFKYCRIKTYVQTAHEHECHDLSMDFHLLCFSADPEGVGVGIVVCFFSVHYLLNQLMDFDQICIDTLLGEGNQLIRFWCPCVIM